MMNSECSACEGRARLDCSECSGEVLGVLTGQVPVRSMPVAMNEPEDDTDDEGSESA